MHGKVILRQPLPSREQQRRLLSILKNSPALIGSHRWPLSGRSFILTSTITNNVIKELLVSRGFRVASLPGFQAMALNISSPT